MITILRTVIVACLLVISCTVFAQYIENKSKKIDNVDKFFNELKSDTTSKKATSLMPAQIPGMNVNESTQEAFNHAMQEFYAYRSSLNV